jgi:hypothetical protein
MKSKQVASGLLIVAITMASFTALAQGPLVPAETKLLVSIGQWLVGYAGGKALDAFGEIAFGKKSESKLEGMVADLQARSRQDTANRNQIEAQLKIANAELRVLHQLMNDAPSAKQLKQDRKELATDLKTIRNLLDEHEKRLDAHDKKFDEHDLHLADNDRRLTELERQQLGSPAPSELPGVTPSPSQVRPHSAGRLRIEVRGRGNLIRLREATHSVFMGTFRLTRSDWHADYSLPPEALAIIELFAPASRISMPQRLAHQVQILSHGFSYQTQLY